MKLFKKSTIPHLNTDDASQILENVFEENEVEPNTIPLEVLESYSNYRRERFSLQRTIVLAFMVLFLLLPSLFIAPTFTLEAASQEQKHNPIYEASLDTFIPVERVTAVINGRNIPVYEVETHVYSIEPTMNGNMEVTITLVNKQTVTKRIQVENVDLDSPIMVFNHVDKDYVYLYVTDSGSGIDYENIYAKSSSEENIKPAFYDEKLGCIAFDYPKNPLNIYIPDHAKNTLMLILSLK